MKNIIKKIINKIIVYRWEILELIFIPLNTELMLINILLLETKSFLLFE